MNDTQVSGKCGACAYPGSYTGKHTLDQYCDLATSTGAHGSGAAPKGKEGPTSPVTLDLTAIQARVNAEVLAREFHETYERLAPQFGYETRKETREFDPITPNGRLMVAVCEVIASRDIPALIREVQALRSRLATVTGAVKEWQEARKAEQAAWSDPTDHDSSRWLATQRPLELATLTLSALSVEGE